MTLANVRVRRPKAAPISVTNLCCQPAARKRASEAREKQRELLGYHFWAAQEAEDARGECKCEKQVHPRGDGGGER